MFLQEKWRASHSTEVFYNKGRNCFSTELSQKHKLTALFNLSLNALHTNSIKILFVNVIKKNSLGISFCNLTISPVELCKAGTVSTEELRGTGKG